MRRGNRVDIWGEGGLFQQRLADVMGKEDRELDIKQQRADTDSDWSAGRLEVDEYRANSERLQVGEPDDGSGGGLLQLGKGKSKPLFDNEGTMYGLRGSAVGRGLSGTRGSNFGSRTATSYRDKEGGTGSEMKDPSAYMNRGGRVPEPKELDQKAKQSKTTGSTKHRIPPKLPRVVNPSADDGMRGYKWGKMNNKVKQPGFAKGGKVKMPEQTGPIGDVDRDDGRDKVDAVVREGEYLLNPETVAHMGGGDYEQGVRNLNQTVRDATGQEPGAEYRDGTAYANKGGLVDDYGRMIDDLTGPTSQHITQAQQSMDDYGVLRQTPDASGVTGNTRAVNNAATVQASTQPVSQFEADAYNRTAEGRQTARLRAEQIVRDRGYGQGTTQTGDKVHTPRAQLPLDSAEPRVKTPAAAAAPENVPKAQRPTFFGRGNEWRAFGKNALEAEQKAQNYVLRNAADTGRLTKAMAPISRPLGAALPLAGIGLSSYQLGQGLRDDNYALRGDVAKGGGDLAASAALFTPAAPAAAAYFAGRAGEEIGGAIYDNMEEETQDNVGGFVSATLNNLSGGRWGESEFDQAERRMAADLVASRRATPEQAAAVAAQERATAEEAAAVAQARSDEYTLPTYQDPEGQVYDGNIMGPTYGNSAVGEYLANEGQDANWSINAGNLRDIPGADGTQYAGRYGGQEVVATTGKYGEPTFTGLRRPEQVAASQLRSQQEQVPLTYEQRTQQRIEDIQSGRSRGGRDELRTLQNNLAQLAYADASRTRGAKPLTAGQKVDDFKKASAPVFSYRDENGENQIDEETQAEFITTVLPQMAMQQNIPMDQIPAEMIQEMGRRWLQQRELGDRYTRSTGAQPFGPEGMALGTGGLGAAREAGLGDVSMFGFDSWNNRKSGFGMGDYIGDFFGPDTMVYDYDDAETGEQGTIPVDDLAPTRDLRRLTTQYGK